MSLGIPQLLMSLLLAAFATAGGGSADTFYVAPGGSDRAPGTRERPFGTIEHGLERLGPGDRLYLRGGRYRERVDVSVTPGRPEARVRVSNFPGERPVLRGQLWIGNPSHWTIRGIDVTWAKGNPNEPMVRIHGGTGWKLAHSEIWGAHSTSGLHVDDGPLDNLGRWRVVGNCIHDTHATNGPNQDHNIYVGDMSASSHPRGVIARNILFNAENGRGIKLGPGGETGGAFNVSVRYNTIYNSSQNVSLSRGTSGVRIYRNILVGGDEANIKGYRLTGADNLARDNLAARAPEFLDDDSGGEALADGGGNLHPRDPRFDSIGCEGFHPARDRGYGVYG